MIFLKSRRKLGADLELLHCEQRETVLHIHHTNQPEELAEIMMS